MGSLHKPVLVAALLGILPGAALAADYAPPIDYPPVPIEIVSGWYLRGDIGYKWYKDPNGRFDVAGYGDMSNESLDDTGVIGLGFGYQYNSHFRTDITIDYEWAGRFRGDLPCPAPCGGGGGGLFSEESADISAWTGLINGYFDFGTWSGFTPYVGAGVGASLVIVDDVAFVNPDGTTGTYGGDEEWNFAWALMAGASYDLSHKLALDLNYRYLSLGDGKSDVALFNTVIDYEDLAAHEVRIGLRYKIY